MLADQIQQYMKKITLHDQLGFIPVMQGCFININVIHRIKTLFKESKTNKKVKLRLINAFFYSDI